MRTVTEDDLTNAIIRYYHEDNFSTVHSVEPEANFNADLSGYPDLYLIVQEGLHHEFQTHKIIEVKSEPAVKRATGANEIIRQFNKYRRYFFEDDYRGAHPVAEWEEIVLQFELCFVPTEYNILHLYDNRAMYAETFKKRMWDAHEQIPVSNEMGGGVIHGDIEIFPTFRDPRSPKPYYPPLNDIEPSYPQELIEKIAIK